MRKIELSQFIDKEIDDLEEQMIVWSLNVYTSSGEFDRVLKAKWKLARMYQSGGTI